MPQHISLPFSYVLIGRRLLTLMTTSDDVEHKRRLYINIIHFQNDEFLLHHHMLTYFKIIIYLQDKNS